MITEILANIDPANPWQDRIQFFDTITSTNDVLKQMALEGAPHGTTLIADNQTSGRGRRGRSFLSPSGVGIYMSVLLRPMCKPEELMHLTCAVASAMCDAIEASCGFRPGIKWTNDIVYKDRKLAGILTELGFDAQGMVNQAVIGIGINCTQKPNNFAEEIQQIAGSLAMVSNAKIDRAKVAAAMVDSLWKMDQLLMDQQRILSNYRKDCVTIGKEISIVRGNDVQHGLAVDIDENGALIVQYSNGEIRTVNSGEVSIRGMYGYI